jgi:lipoyl(octanoyl) transferase
MSDELWVSRCGLVPYEEARQAQIQLAAARIAGEVPDLLLLLEHPPVYTRGRRSKPSELPMGEEWYRAQGIEVCETDRGGAVTYHGPGQLVGYPIVSLAPYGDNVHVYVRRMEQVIIESLGGSGVKAQTIDGLTGVWTAGQPPENGASVAGTARKIGSIGIHISRGVTTHGFAINVNNDLQPFEWIVPCGIEGARITSVSRELGTEQDLDRFAGAVAERFASVYGRQPLAVDPKKLARQVPGVGALRVEAVPAGSAAALP